MADLTNLSADNQAISQGGATLDPQALQTVARELAVAVTTGGSPTQSQTDFTALFASSSVSQTTIDQAYTDLVQTITDSKVAPAGLATVAADQQAIQTDINTLTGNTSAAPGFLGGMAAGGFGPMGNSLASSLSSLGVATSATGQDGPQIDSGIGFGPGFGGSFGGAFGRGFAGGLLAGAGMSSNTQTSQLQTDQTALNTELKALGATSGVTVADITNLSSDSSVIAQAGVWLGGTSLQKVTSELATAVAEDAPPRRPRPTLTPCSQGRRRPRRPSTRHSTICQTIADSKVSSADLQAVATDQQAIQTDLTNLRSGTTTTGTTTSASTTATSSTSPSTTSSTSSTSASGTSATTVPQRPPQPRPRP